MEVYLLQMRQRDRRKPFSSPVSFARGLRELRGWEVSALRLTLEVILQPCDVMRKQPEAPAKPALCSGGLRACWVDSPCTQTVPVTMVKQ